MAPQTFGNRFLTEFHRLGGSTVTWPEAAVALVNQAGRRQFIDALSRASSSTAKALVIAAHTAEPEKLAKRAVALNRSSHGAGAELLLIMVILAAGVA
jgi:hypothetical protein